MKQHIYSSSIYQDHIDYSSYCIEKQRQQFDRLRLNSNDQLYETHLNIQTADLLCKIGSQPSTQNYDDENTINDQELRKRIQIYNSSMKNKLNKRQRISKRSHSKSQLESGQTKQRKIRTTINQKKLEEMNRLFTLYIEHVQNQNSSHKFDGVKKQLEALGISNLKSIGQKLSLGYSTILHKYRQFRATRKVKGGALIASTKQKRKYKKSKQIEGLINDALKVQSFYTAVELSQYIEDNKGIKLSRSIISRHLGQMGYSYKNINKNSVNKSKRNDSSYKDARQIFAEMIKVALERKYKFYYVDEVVFTLNDLPKKDWKNLNFNKEQTDEKVSMLVIVSEEEIIKYCIKNGDITKTDYEEAIQSIFYTSKFRQYNQSKIIAADLKYGEWKDVNEKIREIAKQYNTLIWYFPPESQNLNPISKWSSVIKNKLCGRQYEYNDEIVEFLTKIMQESRQESIKNYYQETEKWLTKALKNENF